MSFTCNGFLVEPQCLLGQGSFGQVVLGCDIYRKVLVAVKRINKKISQRTGGYTIVNQSVQQEIKALNSFSPHDNVVKFLGTFDDSEAFYIVLEYCDMGNLHTYYHTHHPGPKSTVEIMMQITEGVFHLHRSGILHRDIKPQNVMMTYGDRNRPRAKLTDLGLAKVLTNDMSMAETQCGTARYMAPEVTLSQPYSNAADVFSCGVLMLEMTDFMASADVSGVNSSNQNMTIGLEMIRCVYEGIPMPDFVRCTPNDHPVIVAMKDVMRQMILLAPSSRILATTATTLLQNILNSMEGTLEPPPPKPQRNLPPSLAIAMAPAVPAMGYPSSSQYHPYSGTCNPPAVPDSFYRTQSRSTVWFRPQASFASSSPSMSFGYPY